MIKKTRDRKIAENNFTFLKERQKQIIKMKEDGLTYKEIAIVFNLNKSRIHKIANQEIIFEKYFQPPSVFDKLPEWRKKGNSRNRYLARLRDNFTCQGCHKKWKSGERHFDCHHLNGLCGKKSQGYDKLHEIDQLITLCHR